jgi:MoaA/NifB/PqqE/SkfB family radical SAM enzyme
MRDLLFRRIVLYYTDKCTAQCSHCVTRSGPKNLLKLPLQDALECLNAAYGLGIHAYGITGGEPLIYLDEIKELVRHGSSLGMNCAISTNAFWGKTYEKALEMCSFLHDNKVVALNLSADIFHNQFVAIDRVLNVIKAASAIGNLSTLVTAVITRKDPTSVEILKRLSEHPSNVKIIAPAPFGRGSELPANLLLSEPTSKILHRRCDEVNSPVVAPDGRVLTCCSFPVSLDLQPSSPFILGNIYDEPLASILQRASGNPWLELLDKEGPGGFIYQFGEALEERGYEVKQRYHGHCDLCVDLFRAPFYLNTCCSAACAPTGPVMAAD